MPDFLLVLVAVLSALTLIATLLNSWALFFKRHETAERVSPDMHVVVQQPAAGLPPGHNWAENPLEVTNTTGTFDRWICLDCAQHVDLRRGQPWPIQ